MHCSALVCPSISQINGVIWQNEKDLPDYYQAIEANKLPVIKGVGLTHDDRIRADLIAEVICHFKLDIEKFESKWSLTFSQYFAESFPRRSLHSWKTV